MATQDITPHLDNRRNALSLGSSVEPAGTKSPENISPHNFPAFPEAAYVGVGAEWAELISQHYESPKEFCYLAFLLRMGTILSGRVRADFADLGTEPRLFGLKIGPSGTSRKSSSDKHASKYLQQVLNQAAPKDKAQEDDEATYGTVVDHSQKWWYVLPGAGSAEGVLNAMQMHPRIFLSFDEFERFTKKAGADGSVLGTLVNELFESTEYSNATKESISKVTGVYLGFSANIALDQFESVAGSNKMMELGLWNRMIFVVADRKRKIDNPTAPSAEQMKVLVNRLAEYLRKLWEKDKKGKWVPVKEVRLPMTLEARERWKNLEAVIGTDETSTRLDTSGMRVLAILAFTSGKTEIDVEVVEATFAFLRYQRQIRQTYRPSRAVTKEAAMEEAILRSLKKAQVAHQENPAKPAGLTDRELRNAVSADKMGIQAYRAAQQILIKEGFVRQATNPKLPGEKTAKIRYELAPDNE